MRLHNLAFVFFALVSNFAHAQCLNDYHFNQKWNAHRLSSEQISTLQQFSQTHQPGAGWRMLGQLGDRYAALAADVIAPQMGSPGKLLHDYIARHWENTVGRARVDANFESFANQHFRQYVEILSTGTWPDADQILNSYLQSARDHGLPEIIVFDAAWEASDFARITSWQILNQLPAKRRLKDSKICSSITRAQANRSLRRDLLW